MPLIIKHEDITRHHCAHHIVIIEVFGVVAVVEVLDSFDVDEVVGSWCCRMNLLTETWVYVW